MEHGHISFETVGNQVRAAAMTGMDAMVRVAKGCYSDFIRPFEVGATGIMVPHCMSAEEAAEIVQTTRFQPIGRRAMDGGNADGAYCMLPPTEYTRFTNEQRFVIAQVEDKEAVDRMDEILAVDGIDVFFLGAGDLSHSYGVTGEVNHPLVQGAIDKLAECAAKYNRHWGLPCGPDDAPRRIEQGARFLAAGADVLALTAYFKDMRGAYEKAGLRFDAEF